MFGDHVSAKHVFSLLDKYDSFYALLIMLTHKYFWGEGEGIHVWKQAYSQKLVVASSLAKGFATLGGVLVFPDKEWAKKVRNCGTTFNS